MDTLQTQRNRRSPRVPNQPWRGPAGLTIAQMVALLAAVVLAVALWWVSGYLPGSSAFGVLAGRMIVTGFVGGIAAVLFYAAADPSREPFVRQQMLYPFHRHVYRKEPTHGTHAHATRIPFPTRRPRAGRARVAGAIRAATRRPALPRRRAGQRS